jgi:hypothetical protein
MSKFTRRELAAALSTSAVLLARPQVQPPAPDLPANADEDLKGVEAQLRGNADQLDNFPLPMATEPATIFKP